MINPITVSKVTGAYALTGYVPVLGGWYVFKDGKTYCCPLVALLATNGLSLDWFMALDSLTRVEKLTYVLGLEQDYVRGFLQTIDGNGHVVETIRSILWRRGEEDAKAVLAKVKFIPIPEEN